MASIFALLKKFKNGLDMGSIQSVDEMSVIPLVGDDRGDIVADPQELKFQRTTNYGSMQFDNTERSRPAIVPSNYMVRGTGAQDHAMSSAGIVAGGKTKTFDTACCIESSQGGYLGGANNEYDVLPIGLRKNLLPASMRNRRSYDKLWPSIEEWLKGIGINSYNAHLRYFYDDKNIRQALEDFAAEFEPIPNQIGAIILFNEMPVGFEVMPTTIHWNTYWKYLIRGCYGAELIRMKKLGIVKSSRLALPDIPAKTTPEELAELFSSYQQSLTAGVIPLLEKINVKDYKAVSSTSGLEMNFVTTTSGGGGDVIAQGQEPVYASIVF